MQIACVGIAIVSVSLALQIWVGPASAQTTPKQYSATVSVHRDLLNLQEQEVQDILDGMSRILKTKDSGADFSCDVTFKLTGPVGVFGSAETPKEVGAVVEKREEQLYATHRIDFGRGNADFHIKVVDSIRGFCRFEKGQLFAGCAFPPNFRSIIVQQPSENRAIAPILWAHEFGHLTGLGHLDGNDLLNRMDKALMSPCKLKPTNVEITEDECKCLQYGPGFGPYRACNLKGRRTYPECPVD